MRSAASGSLFLLCLSSTLFSSPQTPAERKSDQETIRVTTRLVEVSVIVHDKNGAPVRGLTKDDFRLYENGKEQPIELFSVASGARDPGPSESLPPDTFTNQPRLNSSSGGVTVILIDQLNTRWEDQAYAREKIVQFLGQIRSEDRVALYVLLSNSVRVLHDFTSDAGSLVRAVSRHLPRDSSLLAASEAEPPDTRVLGEDFTQWLEGAYEQIANLALITRVGATAKALESVAQRLAGVPGRKNLIWVSSAFPFTINDEEAVRTFSPEVTRATQAITHANVALYPVDARGLVGAFLPGPARAQGPRVAAHQTVRNPIDTMQIMAESTGGKAFYNTNDLATSIRRAVDDTRYTYILGYYPNSGRWDGRFRKIRVRVNRPGASVRHRTGYLSLPPLPTDSQPRSEAIREVARNPREATAIGLRASISRVQDSTSLSIRIDLRADSKHFHLERQNDRWIGSIDFLVLQETPEGLFFTDIDQTLNLRLTDEMRDRMMKEGMLLDRRVTLREGTHRILVVLRDVSTGMAGSLAIPLSSFRAEGRS